MESQYSENDYYRAHLTLESILETIDNLLDWNEKIKSVEDYHSTLSGVQLLTANCTLITAIGEGINRVNRSLPNFLADTFPDVPWKLIIGMRNRIAHGYFELDAEQVFKAIKKDFPELRKVIQQAITIIGG